MKLLIAIYRFFLSLRYSVEITGTEVLREKGAKFILPNHQALIDPQLMFAHLYRYITVVPVVTESFYNNPVLNKLFKASGAVPVSDLSTGSRDINVLNTIFENVTAALKNGENVLLYPSGQIAGQGYEKIFNKQSAWTVVNSLPENTRVIGVRINGLWGSMWSRAWAGKTPDFFKTFLKGVFYIFANLIFFVPKRKVTIELDDITEEAKINAKENRLAFNSFLEKFYNKNGEEPVNFLKHYFYFPRSKRQLPEKIAGSAEEVKSFTPYVESDIPEEIFEQITDIIIRETNLNKREIKITSNLTLDLNVDSLMLVTIIAAIEKQFEVISQLEPALIKTVEDLCRIAMGFGVIDETLKPSYLHIHKAPFTEIKIDKTKNIVELFLETFSSNKDEYFAYDKIMGTTTRKEFLLKAMVLSKIIRKEVKGKEVGIMLPALQSTTLLVISSYLAGKVPVMLNWTVGKNVMEHCVKTVDLKQILTARSFYTKIENLLPESVKQKCIFFEQKVSEIGIATKLSGLISYLLRTKPKIKHDDTAVILFTSGSESLPKAVPLTHRNIVSDLWGGFSLISIKTDIMLLAFLPPFHSFGFTVLTIFPLLSGVKTAYSPDPTDSRELLKILNHTRVNTILGTPTFLKQLINVTSHAEMKLIKLAISGAESMPPSLTEKFYQKCHKGALLLEGYGITECSPIITINTLEKQKENSVGVFINGVEHLIVDINTNEPVNQGEQGMILVKGDNVFKGYPDKSISSPFVKVGEDEYYKTGDLGYVDKEGYLYITGRLKRFIKIGGEMISLPAIENALLKKYGSEEQTVLAIEGTDTTQPPQIVLFSTIGMDLTEINLYLKQSGFSNLIKINRIIHLDEIPLLGTGKTDYKILKNMI
jgi:acyl carrier protein